MSVAGYEEGDLFIARVYGHHVNNQNHDFNNSFEFRAATAGSSEDIRTLANDCANFIARMTFETYVISHATVSTWSADSRPYDPDSFLTVSYSNLTGMIPATGRQPLSAEHVLYLKKNVGTGLQGKVHIRFALAEDQVFAPAGGLALSDAGDVSADLESAITLSHMDGYLGPDISERGFNMVLASQVGPLTYARRVLEIVVGGVRLTRTNHRYFDRS